MSELPVSEAEWAELRRQAVHGLPEALKGAELPNVLLPYQQALLATTSAGQVTVCEKSRRTGMTWAAAADAVLTAASARRAGGMDALYLGYNLDMAREFIDTCAMWASSLIPAASAVEEFLFSDQSDDGDSRYIQAFRIRFASGFEIIALTSRPRSLRGRQGYVIIDEAAFHDELQELLKAAMALLIWGGRVLVISTHNGAENPFNELLQDVRAGKRPYGIVRVTFDEALHQGLYQRICLVTGRTWSADGEAEWRSQIYGHYGDDADEELRCIPRASGGKFLPRALVEARMVPDTPVLRWVKDDAFVDESEHVRAADCRDWLAAELRPLLNRLTAYTRTFLGVDFGRTGDLTVFWPIVLEENTTRRTPFVVELRNVPFLQQEQILRYLVDRLPRFSAGKLDARGNGQFLAERARQLYGASVIDEVQLSEPWYRENMPPMKAAFEDGTITLPEDADILDDFRSLEVVRGVARIPEKARTKGKHGQRHGDAAVAAALAYAASREDGGPVEVMTAGEAPAGARAFGAADAPADWPSAGDFADFMGT